MKQYIDRAIVAAELKRRINNLYPKRGQGIVVTKILKDHYEDLLSFLDNIEVKEMDTWHLQEKENIYDAVKDWSLYTFACLMKDGTIQRFNGCLDEDCEGNIDVHIDGVNDDYDDVDDIVKWIEYT